MLGESRILQMQAAVSLQKGSQLKSRNCLCWNKLDCATNWYIQKTNPWSSSVCLYETNESVLTNCIIIWEACNRLANHVFTGLLLLGLPGIVKKLQEKHSGAKNLIRYVLELKSVCSSHQDGVWERGTEGKEKKCYLLIWDRDLYFKATSNQGDWQWEEILPITTGVNPLRSHILWKANFIEKKEKEKEPFLHYTLESTEVPYTLCLFSICCKRAAFWNNLGELHK